MSTWAADAPGVLQYPSGRRVRGRALRRRRSDGPPPDLALHLSGRAPRHLPPYAVWLRWPDFRGPADPAEAARVLTQAWQRAADERVELACRGGRGRTGTALACLAVLDGMAAAGAVAFVRRGYDQHAVETAGQRRFVAAFAADLR